MTPGVSPLVTPGVIPSDSCDVPEVPPPTGAFPPVVTPGVTTGVTQVVNPGVTLEVIPNDP